MHAVFYPWGLLILTDTSLMQTPCIPARFQVRYFRTELFKANASRFCLYNKILFHCVQNHLNQLFLLPSLISVHGRNKILQPSLHVKFGKAVLAQDHYFMTVFKLPCIRKAVCTTCWNFIGTVSCEEKQPVGWGFRALDSSTWVTLQGTSWTCPFCMLPNMLFLRWDA